jgi:hypothetical protein
MRPLNFPVRPPVRALTVIFLVALSTLQATEADPTLDYSKATVSQLVDDLVNIDAQTNGLHSTAWLSGFIAENGPDRFEGGVLGSVAPKRFPQMVELVRRGVASLPILIDHLGDRRPTKVVVGSSHFFTFEYFSDEYDPKIRPVGQGGITTLSHYADDREEFKVQQDHSFDGEYTVRVGDVCYALIGQIVNRNLLAVRYQPSAILVVNSPIEAPALIAAVKRDWSGIDSSAHMTSLLNDARASDNLRLYGPALQRLRFYYPSEYQRQLQGDLQEKISAFEADQHK